MAGICIALVLMALTGGMFLLAKTNKDNLGAFFKVISWAVIVISILALVCCLCCCMMGRCGMRGGHCGSYGGGCEMQQHCGPGGMEKRMIIMRGGHGGCEEMESCEAEAGCGEGMQGECCKGKKEDCCKMKGEGCAEEAPKDSAAVKK